MNITIERAGSSKRRSAILVLFASFTALFLAYVDLYLVFDNRAFRGIASDFWHIYNSSFLVFLGLVIAVLATAICLTIFTPGSGASGKYTSVAVVVVGALLAVIAWFLFVTIHGFGISVVAVLATFVTLLASVTATSRNRPPRASYRYVLIPGVLSVLGMIGVLVLTILSYLTLNTVSPFLFQANAIELFIVGSIIVVSTLIAAIFAARAVLL